MDETPITYRTDRRARSIRIKIEATGSVIVVSPPFTPKFIVTSFVNRQQAWISAQLAKLASAPQRLRAQTPTTLLVFGKSYTKQVLYQADQPSGVTILGNRVMINPIDAQTEPTQMINRFLKSTAAHYIPARVAQLASTMQTTYGAITLRQQKTRWGSCSSQGNLNFNWRLVHFEPKIIDYVIIHELAHRTHMNHSKAFWNLVEQYDPEYRLHRGFLKRYGMMVG